MSKKVSSVTQTAYKTACVRVPVSEVAKAYKAMMSSSFTSYVFEGELMGETAPAETSEEETIRIVNAANKDLAEGLAKAKHELAVLHEVASYAWEGVKDVPMLIQPSHRDKTMHHMLTVWRALGTYSTRPDRNKDG